MIRPGQRPIRRPKKSPDRQQTDYNPQVAHPIINPIILQVPNRDANSVKLIRPVQGTFSGLQNAPDSDRFTFLIRRLGGSSPPGRTRVLAVQGPNRSVTPKRSSRAAAAMRRRLEVTIFAWMSPAECRCPVLLRPGAA